MASHLRQGGYVLVALVNWLLVNRRLKELFTGLDDIFGRDLEIAW